jgi:hypothetical protein
VSRRRAGVVIAAALAACAPLPQLPEAPVPAGPPILIESTPVLLDPTDPRRIAVGAFTYAGGLVLTSRQTSRLHGLSDLKVGPDGALLMVNDQADLFEARVVLDAQGRLSGLADARLTALKDATGLDLHAGGQHEYDSEGVARLANGAMVVAFEQHDRILAYPAGGGPPHPAPMPATPMARNKGMEALMAAPEAGPDAYRLGIEKTGQLFLCRLSAGCVPDGAVDLKGLELVAMDVAPGVGRAYLLRSFSPLQGNVVQLRIVDDAGRTLDSLQLSRPLTVDNLEGLAAVAAPAGGLRFYLVSDDNFGLFEGRPTHQRTLLLAFDWSPKTKRPPQGAASSKPVERPIRRRRLRPAWP